MLKPSLKHVRIEAIALFFIFTYMKSECQVTNYLGMPDTISYSNITYQLSWSSHPTENYFKQEYNPISSRNKNAATLVTVEALIGDFTLPNVMASKIQELNERKKKDPVLNYRLRNSPDETTYILDFIVSTGEKVLDTVEWNAYKYDIFKDKLGHSGVRLVEITFTNTTSIRAFLESLSDLRNREIIALEKFNSPEINISK